MDNILVKKTGGGEFKYHSDMSVSYPSAMSRIELTHKQRANADDASFPSVVKRNIN